MGKNKRRQIAYFDSVHNVNVECDSQEEIDVFNWMIEAVNRGLVIDFAYQPPSYKLSDTVKYIGLDNKERTLFREHIYSPDFKLTFCPAKAMKLAKELKVSINQADANELPVYIDVKGTFARSDGGRSFSINQKWVMQKHGIYIYKLVPKDFFKLFGVPKASTLTAKTKKPRKMFLSYPEMDVSLFN